MISNTALLTLIRRIHRSLLRVYSVALASRPVVEFCQPIVRRNSTRLISRTGDYTPDVRHGDIDAQIFLDAVLVPHEYAAYTSDGRLISSSCLNRGGIKNCVHAKSLIDLSEVKVQANIERAVFGGVLFPNHWGHFLTESLSRAWVLFDEELQECLEFTTVFIPQHRPHARFASNIQTLMNIILDGRKSLVIDRPTHVSQLIVPQPTIRNNNWLHCKHADLLRDLGNIVRASGEAKGVYRGQPVYLSRSNLQGGERVIAGEKALERRLAKLGVLVVHPEVLSIADQIEIFTSAKIIIGMVGSSFHTMLLASPSERPSNILIRGNYLNRNFPNIDAACETESTYIHGSLPHPLNLKRKAADRDEIIPVDGVYQVLRTIVQKAA